MRLCFLFCLRLVLFFPDVMFFPDFPAPEPGDEVFLLCSSRISRPRTPGMRSSCYIFFRISRPRTPGMKSSCLFFPDFPAPDPGVRVHGARFCSGVQWYATNLFRIPVVRMCLPPQGASAQLVGSQQPTNQPTNA